MALITGLKKTNSQLTLLPFRRPTRHRSKPTYVAVSHDRCSPPPSRKAPPGTLLILIRQPPSEPNIGSLTGMDRWFQRIQRNGSLARRTTSLLT